MVEKVCYKSDVGEDEQGVWLQEVNGSIGGALKQESMVSIKLNQFE